MIKTKLRKLRDSAGIRPGEIASFLGVDRIHYWRIENGRGNPSFDLALRIAHYWKLRGKEISAEDIFYPRKRKAKDEKKAAA